MTKYLIILLSILILAFGLLNFQLLAEESATTTTRTDMMSPTEERQALEEELKKLEEQIAQYDKDITKTQEEKKTFQNQIDILKKQVEKLDLQIRQGNVIIKELKIQVDDTEDSIGKTSLELEDSKQKLADILRLIYKEDQKSLIEILLSEDRLSDFFSHLAALDTLNLKNQELLANIESLKGFLGDQKQSLDEKKENSERTVQIQSLQKQESAKTKEEKDRLLKLTEAEYQRYLKEKEGTEKKAAEIRAKIYELIGVREAVTYAQALEVAKYVASLVGIRPALLLGILSQESAIGRNVGQCYLKNTSTGAGVVAYNGETISRVMNPTRDVPPFLNIIKELNSNKKLALNPFETFVSCPMSFGWGGAMGPAQFIPSTWVLYENRIKEKVGSSPDPWNIRDASFAASLYLKDGLDNYSNEGKAVQAYFCGYPKNDYWCSWYEKNVLYLTSCHQTFIDKGSMSLQCQEAIGLK